MSIRDIDKMYMPQEFAARAEPAWRWNRIVELADKDVPRFLTSDDELIRRGVFFLKDFQAANTKEDTRTVYERHQFTYLAHGLFRTNHYMASVIEAMITVDVPTSSIAKTVSQPKEVVRRYEDLFYDVREQCKNPAFVTTCLLPESIAGVGAADLDSRLKLLARFKGPKLIRALIGKFFMDSESADLLRDSIKVELLKGSMDVLSNVRPNSHNFMEYLQAAGVVEIENQENVAGGVTAIAVQLLQQLQFAPPQLPTEVVAAKEISLGEIKERRQLEAK